MSNKTTIHKDSVGNYIVTWHDDSASIYCHLDDALEAIKGDYVPNVLGERDEIFVDNSVEHFGETVSMEDKE